jgi:hypothetical protein
MFDKNYNNTKEGKRMHWAQNSIQKIMTRWKISMMGF